MTKCCTRNPVAGNPTKFRVESARIPSGFHSEFGRILVGLGSKRIRVIPLGLVGIWSEFGRNDSESE
jgi:hypothetical protein